MVHPLEALRGLGASPYVLLSRCSHCQDVGMDTSLHNLLGEQTGCSVLARRIWGVGKALLRSPFRLNERHFVKDLIITRGLDGFDFINQAGVFILPDAFLLADHLADLRLPLRLETSPAMDIWHTTVPSPISVHGARKITTIHDLIPLRLPHATLDRKAHTVLLLQESIASSAVLTTISETTKRDLIEFFGVPPDKIVVTYQPIALPPTLPSRSSAEKVLKAYGLKPDGYILFVGAIEPKKNLRRLLRAYAMIETDLPLVVAGRKGWLVEQELAPLQHNPALQARVRFLDYLPSDELPAFYAGARCLTFPSLYEGFGLPPLEAMTFGCPVLTSKVASLPEVCADAAVYVDPYQPNDIAEQLARLIDDGNLRARLIQAGYQRAEFFSMEKYQQRLRDVYLRALR